MLSQVCSLLVELINIIYLGHTNDTNKIAGVGLGNMYVNITCQAVILGLNGAISTLASQAYGA